MTLDYLMEKMPNFKRLVEEKVAQEINPVIQENEELKERLELAEQDNLIALEALTELYEMFIAGEGE